jgi:hypothetical protein
MNIMTNIEGGCTISAWPSDARWRPRLVGTQGYHGVWMTGKTDGDHFHLFGTYIGRYAANLCTGRPERQMCGFRKPRRTQAFLSCFDHMRQQCGAT